MNISNIIYNLWLSKIITPLCHMLLVYKRNWKFRLCVVLHTCVARVRMLKIEIENTITTVVAVVAVAIVPFQPRHMAHIFNCYFHMQIANVIRKQRVAPAGALKDFSASARTKACNSVNKGKNNNNRQGNWHNNRK